MKEKGTIETIKMILLDEYKRTSKGRYTNNEFVNLIDNAKSHILVEHADNKAPFPGICIMSNKSKTTRKNVIIRSRNSWFKSMHSTGFATILHSGDKVIAIELTDPSLERIREESMERKWEESRQESFERERKERTNRMRQELPENMYHIHSQTTPPLRKSISTPPEPMIDSDIHNIALPDLFQAHFLHLSPSDIRCDKVESHLELDGNLLIKAIFSKEIYHLLQNGEWNKALRQLNQKKAELYLERKKLNIDLKAFLYLDETLKDREKTFQYIKALGHY